MDLSSLEELIDHRPLLQYVMASKTVSEKNLTKFWMALYYETHKTEEARQVLADLQDRELIDCVERLVAKINVKLLPLSYEIKRHKDKTGMANGLIYYSYINTLEDEPSKINTDLTADDVKVVSKIIQSCIENYEENPENGYRVTSSDALNAFREEGTKMRSMKSGEAMLQKMIEDGWLIRDGKDYVLGLRMMAELESQFTGTTAVN